MFMTLVPSGCTSRTRNAASAMTATMHVAAMPTTRGDGLRAADAPVDTRREALARTRSATSRATAYTTEKTSRATANHGGPEAERNLPDSTKSR